MPHIKGQDGHGRDKDVRGFTLVELLITLTLMILLLSAGVHWQKEGLPRHRVVSASNQVLGLIHYARAEALTRGPIFLCDGSSHCDRFQTTSSLLLARSGDGIATITDDDVFHRLDLPEGTTLTWRRFRGTALRYERRGNLYYQNGSFLICNQGQGRRIVMSVMGTARIEPISGGDCL
nr:GspH/FimT family protein [Alloalcanivorax xenomutans]